MGVESMIWSHYGKAVLLLLIIVIILQAYHMSKLMKYQDKKNSQIHARNNVHQEMKNDGKKEMNVRIVQHIKQDDLLKYTEKLENPHIMDSSGTYMIIPDILSTVVKDSNANLSICTQTTANHLHYLNDLTETWDGVVSVTVFTHGNDAVYALYSAVYMHTCLEKVKTSVMFHIAFPISNPPLNLKTITNMEMHCDNLESFRHENENNYENEIPYPHNVLRNIAATYTITPYILMIDIDMIPSKHLNSHFSEFLNRKQNVVTNEDKNREEKLVYVLPAFESKTSNKIPDKQSLVYEWDLQNVRPFYQNVCWKCQKVTDYDRWRALPSLPFFDVGFILGWEDPWEPFYIAKKENLPLYDGRFKQYGFNRISQVCELHVAGYQFAVLNNAFLMHRGFKEPEKFHSKKDAENNRNRELFKQFKEELKERYPLSNRQC